METWNKDNLPENHVFFDNIKFVACTEGTWKRKKNDGADEVVPKWNFITEADKEGASVEIQVYSATDKEEIKMNTAYDVIAKRNVGKDGTFYGYSIKGFAAHGTPIQKKEPQSRFQKGQKLNAKAEALKAAAQITKPSDKPNPDEVIAIAELFEAYINGEYKGAAASGSETTDSKD